MFISNYSSSLNGSLKRSLGKIPLEFEKAFILAISSGGNAELDFTREEGVSYNPQAARIAMILLQNASCKDEMTLIASQLIFPLQNNENDKALFSEFPKEALEIATLSLQEFSEITTQPKSKIQHNALLVFSACLLDRLRHFHLAQKEFIAENRNFFIDTATRCAGAVKELAPELGTLLAACAERLTRNKLPA